MIRSVIKPLVPASLLVLLSARFLYAQEAAPAGSPLGGFFPLIIIFVIFYFFLIRPQQKKAKEHQKMLNALKKDDRIVTTGGIFGTITGIKGDTVEVKIAENVKILLARSAVSSVVSSESQQAAPPPDIIK